MKLAIMQPYFFPYIGYFQLISATDKWIIFDIVQYMRHHWVNRNRVLHPQSDWQYIIVPLTKQPRGTLINDIKVDNSQAWQKKLLAQMTHYKKKAPFYKETLTFLDACFSSAGTAEDNLLRLNTIFLEKTCQKLGISFNYSVCSELDLRLGAVTHPGEWALRISEQMGADIYINPVGGADIFDTRQFEDKGIDLCFLMPEQIRYEQKGYKFVPDLSIIDVMMWNSEEEIRTILKNYRISAAR